MMATWRIGDQPRAVIASLTARVARDSLPVRRKRD